MTSDKGVIMYHNLLLDQIAKVERGEEPMAVVRDPAVNEPMINIAREVTPREPFRRGLGDTGLAATVASAG